MKCFRFQKFLMAFIPLFLFSGCGTKNANTIKSFLNYKYVLLRAGDLHGLSPTASVVLDEKNNKGFTNYINLFDKEKSYINFQCKGTSYDDFYCEASFFLFDAKGNELMKNECFICEYSGGQTGTIIFEENETKEQLGTIYVYTPYWCRWQFEYSVDDSDEKTLITFEFWKSKYNDLPTF